MTQRTKRRARKPRVAREKPVAYKAARLSLTRAEQRALAQFRARLHEILPKGELKSLILYGSKARGEPHPGSDVDLLIVHDSARPEITNEIYDALSEIQMGWFERENVEIPIQPLVQTAAELKQDSALGEPLLQNIAREGIVLEGEPIMPEQMDRKHYSSLYIEEGQRKLRTAHLALADGDIRSPISMAFDIYEHAMRAALIAKNIAPQSHEGTASLFGLHFVKTGLVPKMFSVHFDRMVKNRLNADYHPEIPFDREDAERALERAEELLITIENLLPKLLAEK
jgi:uncharacterized protein (UPF0332 family)/predicted nucleotidyltransferase